MSLWNSLQKTHRAENLGPTGIETIVVIRWPTQFRLPVFLSPPRMPAVRCGDWSFAEGVGMNFESIEVPRTF